MIIHKNKMKAHKIVNLCVFALKTSQQAQKILLYLLLQSLYTYYSMILNHQMTFNLSRFIFRTLSNATNTRMLLFNSFFIYFNQIQFIRIQMDRSAAPLNFYASQNVPFTATETRYIASSDKGQKVPADPSGKIPEQSQTYQFRTYNPERPISSNGQFLARDNRTVNRSQMIGQSQLTSSARASRYNNKYSFKRHSALQNPLASTIQQNNSFIQSNYKQGSEITQQKTQLQQRDALLAQKDITISQKDAQIAQMSLQLNRIRDLALQRKIRVQNLPASADNVEYINAFIQIYNISIATSKNEKYGELQSVSFVPFALPPPNQVNNLPIIVKPNIPQPQPNQLIVNQVHRPIINYIPHQPTNIPNNIDNFNPNNNFILPINDYNNKDTSSTEHFIREIRELRTKVELLEEEKTTLIDKIRYYERNNGFSNLNSQETIETYRHEIENLKIQINELTQLYHGNMKNTDTQRELTDLKHEISSLNQNLKEYEEQLLQAQQHIIYLENQKKTEDLETEINNLRSTIARYTEHLEQVELQRQRYEETILQKDQEYANLNAENHKMHEYLEELQVMNEKLAAQQAKLARQIDTSNTVDRDSYYELLVMYGKKEFQSIVLLEEINRLNVKFNECHQHLQKAQDFIIQLQESLERVSSSQPFQSESILYQSQHLSTNLETVHDEYSRKIATMTHQYETAIENLHKQNYDLKARIEYSNVNISNMQQEIYRLESNQTNFVLEYQQMEHKYKSVVEQLNVKFDELHSERLQLTHQLAQAHAKVASSPPVKEVKDDKQFNDLEASIAQLNAQLAQTTEHLKKAEDYIEENLHAWSEKKEFEIHYQERLVFIEHLTRDFELLKLENKELATRLYDYQNVVHQAHTLNEQNARLIEALKELQQQPGNEQDILLLREENIKLFNTLRDLQSSYHQLALQLTSIKEENVKLLKKIDVVESERNIQAQNLRELDSNKGQLIQDVNYLRGQISELNNSLQRNKVALVQSNNRIQELQSSNVTDILSKELEAAKQQINESNSKLVAFNTVIQELQLIQAENQKLYAAFRQTEDLYNSSLKQIQIMESSISSNTQTYQVLEQEIITLRQQNNDLQTRVQASDKLILQIRILKEELVRLQGQIQQKQTALITSRTIFQEIENELKKEADANRQFQQKLEESDRYISSLRAKLIEAEQFLQNSEVFIKDQQKIIRDTQQNNKELRSHLEGAEHYIRDLEERSKVWQHERDQSYKYRHAYEQDNIKVHLALKKAEAHIFELEAALLKK